MGLRLRPLSALLKQRLKRTGVESWRGSSVS